MTVKLNFLSILLMVFLFTSITPATAVILGGISENSSQTAYLDGDQGDIGVIQQNVNNSISENSSQTAYLDGDQGDIGVIQQNVNNSKNCVENIGSKTNMNQNQPFKFESKNINDSQKVELGKNRTYMDQMFDKFLKEIKKRNNISNLNKTTLGELSVYGNVTEGSKIENNSNNKSNSSVLSGYILKQNPENQVNENTQEKVKVKRNKYLSKTSNGFRTASSELEDYGNAADNPVNKTRLENKTSDLSDYRNAADNTVNKTRLENKTSDLSDCRNTADSTVNQTKTNKNTYNSHSNTNLENSGDNLSGYGKDVKVREQENKLREDENKITRINQGLQRLSNVSTGELPEELISLLADFNFNVTITTKTVDAINPGDLILIKLSSGKCAQLALFQKINDDGKYHIFLGNGDYHDFSLNDLESVYQGIAFTPIDSKSSTEEKNLINDFNPKILPHVEPPSIFDQIMSHSVYKALIIVGTVCTALLAVVGVITLIRKVPMYVKACWTGEIEEVTTKTVEYGFIKGGLSGFLSRVATAVGKGAAAVGRGFAAVGRGAAAVGRGFAAVGRGLGTCLNRCYCCCCGARSGTVIVNGNVNLYGTFLDQPRVKSPSC